MEAFESYVKVAKTLKAFEQAKHDQWLKECLPVIESTLQMQVLRVDSTGIKEGTVSFRGNLKRNNLFNLTDFVFTFCLGF